MAVKKTVASCRTHFSRSGNRGIAGPKWSGKLTFLKLYRRPFRRSSTVRRCGSPKDVFHSRALRVPFHPEMTGHKQLSFVARIYGADTSALISKFVADFSDLDIHFLSSCPRNSTTLPPRPIVHPKLGCVSTTLGPNSETQLFLLMKLLPYVMPVSNQKSRTIS